MSMQTPRRLSAFLLLQTIILLLFSVTLVRSSGFFVYWNIPTFMCKPYDLPITNVTQYYGIVQNTDDDFRGDKINILYDPGMFPAILKNKSSNSYFYRNGGVPQQGNLYEHLRVFEQHVNEQIPNPGFDGVAVIDFESWRPIFRQNFGTLEPYKTLSIEIERSLHPNWPSKSIEQEAVRRFEFAGRNFMEQTIYLAQKLRPLASWGYYAYPYCFNGRGENVESCAPNVQQENNRLRWLFEGSDILFPSVYMQEDLPENNRALMVAGRVREAIRMTNALPRVIRPGVLAYHRYVYTDTIRYLSMEDTYNALHTIKQNGADGVVLWGSSYDLNSRTKCTEFYNYLVQVLGPVIASLDSRYYISPFAYNF